jgi:hypothetical protein
VILNQIAENESIENCVFKKMTISAFSNRKQCGAFLKTHNFKGYYAILKIKLRFCQTLNCVLKNHFIKSHILKSHFLKSQTQTNPKTKNHMEELNP